MFRRLALSLTILATGLVAGLVPARAAIDTSAEHALLMDGASGQVLWQKDGLVAMPPASMSKLMTIDLLFGRLKDGRVKLTDTFPVSERAWRTGGSRMFLELGSRVSVEDLIRGIVEGFVKMMNQRAKQIGLQQSTFVNPDGLPEPPGQMMSALDLAKLARHIINEYSQYYHYFSEREFVWNKIRQPNRDLVLTMLPGADGLKTGHTDAAGYGIVASARRGDQRLILVLNGLRYPQYKNDYFPNIRRAEEASRILEMAFREFRSYSVLKAGQVLGNAPVQGRAAESVAVTAGQPPHRTPPGGSPPGTERPRPRRPGPAPPRPAGRPGRALVVTAPNFPALNVPVFAAQSVEKAGFIGGLWNAVKRKVWN